MSQEKPKLESAPTKLIRKIVQSVKPSIARVRFDAEHGLWAVLGKDNQILRHFSHGIMLNVDLSAHEKRQPRIGCGPAESTHIGIAEGTLYENTYAGHQPVLAENMSFKSGAFHCGAKILTSCKKLFMMPERRALIIE